MPCQQSSTTERAPSSSPTKKRAKPTKSLLEPTSIAPPQHKPTAIQKATQSPTRTNVWTIWYAAQYGKCERVQSILDRHAVISIDVQEYRTKWSALHFACRYGHVDLVQLLLDRGAQPNLQDHLGHTALHLSAGWGSLRCTMLLLSAGANPSLTNPQGQTALDVARVMNRMEQFRTLELWQPIGLTDQELLARRASVASATDPVAVKVILLQRLQTELEAEPDPAVLQELHALHAKTQLHNDFHPALLITLDRLTTLYRNTNRLEQALVTTERALTLAEGVYGQHHEETLTWMNNTAELLQLLNRLEESEHYMQQSYQGLADQLGDTHPATLSALENLAILAYSRHHWNETQHYLCKLLEALHEIFEGGSNDRVFYLRIRLTTVMMNQKRAQEARIILEECVDQAIALFGPEHTHVVRCYDQLGRCWFVLGDFQIAEDYFRHALRIIMSSTSPPELQTQQQRMHNNIAMVTIARRSHKAVQTRLQTVGWGTSSVL